MNINIKQTKEYYFLIYLNKENKADDFKFNSNEKYLKCIYSKYIESKENKGKLIKVFKYSCETKEEIELEFSYDKKNFKLILNTKDKSFIFNVNLSQKNGFFHSDTKIEQKSLEIHEKMGYFINALNKISENDKLDILYQDSINLYSKSPTFQFLINIFINVYHTNLCSKLLDEFAKNFDKPVQKDNIIKESLDQYKFYFDEICKNAEDIISSCSLNKIDFYGLILSYLNNYVIEKYKEKFDELYKNQKNILFEVLLKYKSYFKKQIELSKKILDEIIKFTTKKDMREFKKGLFYLEDINIFLEIIVNNKEEIIKIQNFEPIEVPKVENKEIDFETIIEKIETILEFSKAKKLLLIYFKNDFWESMSKKCPNKNVEHIKILYQLREKLKKYYSLVNTLFKEVKEDKNNNIKKDINNFYKKGIYIRQLDERVKDYIEKNSKITNTEIIDLIKNYDLSYHDNRYKNKRTPDILNKIDLETIDNNSKEKFKQMEFEKIFEEDLGNYLLALEKKIHKITDFDIILELININKLGTTTKSKYLKDLNNKYNIVIRESKLSDSNEKIIKSLANLTYFMCANEDNLNFLEKTINNSSR